MRFGFLFSLLFFAQSWRVIAQEEKLPVWGYVFVAFDKSDAGKVANVSIIKGLQEEIDSMALFYLHENPSFFDAFQTGHYVVPLPFLHLDDGVPSNFSREDFVSIIPDISWKDLEMNTTLAHNQLKFELLAVVKKIHADGKLEIEVHNNFVKHQSNVLFDFQNDAGLRFVQLAFYVSELYAAILRQEIAAVDLYTTPEDLRMLDALQHQLSRERDALLHQMTKAILYGQNEEALANWGDLVTFARKK